MAKGVWRTLRRISRNGRGAPRKRAGIVLAARSGLSEREVAARFQVHPRTVRRCIRRVDSLGATGVYDRTRSGRPRRVTDQVRAAAEELLVHRAAPNGARWTTRALAAALGISLGSAHGLLKALNHLRGRAVRRVLRACGVASPKFDLAGAWCSRTDVVLVFAPTGKRGRRSRMTPIAFERYEKLLDVAADSVREAGRRLASSAESPAGVPKFLEALREPILRDGAIVAHSPGVMLSEEAGSTREIVLPSVACGFDLLARWSAQQRRVKWGITHGMLQLMAAAGAVVNADADMLVTPLRLLLTM